MYERLHVCPQTDVTLKSPSSCLWRTFCGKGWLKLTFKPIWSFVLLKGRCDLQPMNVMIIRAPSINDPMIILNVLLSLQCQVDTALPLNNVVCCNVCNFLITNNFHALCCYVLLRMQHSNKPQYKYIQRYHLSFSFQFSISYTNSIRNASNSCTEQLQSGHAHLQLIKIRYLWYIAYKAAK